MKIEMKKKNEKVTFTKYSPPRWVLPRISCLWSGSGFNLNDLCSFWKSGQKLSKFGPGNWLEISPKMLKIYLRNI
jgi:hypothetical protein